MILLSSFAGQAAYDLERQPAWCDRVLHSKVSVQRKSCSDVAARHGATSCQAP